SWHGIVGEPIAPDEASATGVSLLARAEAHHNGLIVMGAYTHGHYRQFLFGGMTRHVIEHATIPVLFAHETEQRPGARSVKCRPIVSRSCSRRDRSQW